MTQQSFTFAQRNYSDCRTFGEIARWSRLQKHLRQGDVAARIGVATGSVRRLEKGDTPMYQVRTFCALCRTLGITPDQAFAAIEREDSADAA